MSRNGSSRKPGVKEARNGSWLRAGFRHSFRGDRAAGGWPVGDARGGRWPARAIAATSPPFLLGSFVPGFLHVREDG